MLRGLWRAYETQLAANPVRTQMATSCFLWGAGDVLAQRIEHYEEQQYGSSCSSSKSAAASQTDNSSTSAGSQKEHAQPQQPTQQTHQQQQQQPHGVAQDPSSKGFTVDKRRTLLTAVGFGAAFVGPVGEFWYSGVWSFAQVPKVAQLVLRSEGTAVVSEHSHPHTFCAQCSALQHLSSSLSLRPACCNIVTDTATTSIPER
jgi:hypothetical protein